MMDASSRSQLSSLFDQSQDMIIAVDEPGELSLVAAAGHEMIGHDPDQMIGMNAFEFIYEEDRAMVFDRFIELVENPGQSTDRVQHRMKHKDGGTLWVESIGSNQTDTELDGYVINTRNITEIKAYEAELERQIDRLDEFAGVVSHDLRNPLNVAAGRLELAAKDCDSEDIDAAAPAIDRIEMLIEDVLSLARAGQAISDPALVELPDLLDPSWRNVEAESAELVIETDATIRADEIRLQQLFENLFRNALEHGGTNVRISVGDLPGGFYVEDDGSGIPPDIRD